MICLLTLIQLTIALPFMVSQQKLQQASAVYEPESINQSASLGRVFMPMWDSFLGYGTTRLDLADKILQYQRLRWKHSLWCEHIVDEEQKELARYAGLNRGSTGRIAVMY